MPNVPGLFLVRARFQRWKCVAEAAHAKGGYIYAQLWARWQSHSSPGVHWAAACRALSATPWDTDEKFLPYALQEGEDHIETTRPSR